MRRDGFTLLELVVALAVSGVVLLGAHSLWEALVGATDRLTHETAAADARANGERLLRALVGRLHVSADPLHAFVGGEQAVTFATWCDMPAGWQERCDARIAIQPTSSGDLALYATTSAGDSIMLRRGFRAGALCYLSNVRAGGLWFRTWTQGITVPVAIGVIADGDTTIVRIGERG